ncbi:DUF1574 domain-containing protein [Leptospira sp. 96542]|nr:DUF1574 domain-containing protein [Leptospira sp. 96542]
MGLGTVLRTKSFLLYPLYLFLFLLVIDKIFLLPTFHEEFLQAGNSVFYFQRKSLAKRMFADDKLNQTNLALVFGDSRSYPFSELGIPENKRKSWTLYNFSVPQSVPMYSYLNLNQVLEKGVKPKVVILSLSPEAFDDTKGFLLSPFLRMGCDSECRDLVWDYIPSKEKWEYVLDHIFAVRGVELNLSLFTSRLKQGKLKEYKSLYNKEFQLLNYTKGDYLMYGSMENPEEKLKKDTARISNLYMRSYKMGTSQLPFFEKFIKLTNEKGIKTIVVWPKVYGDYYQFYDKFNVRDVWWEKIKAVGKPYGTIFIDMNTESSCNLFNDASHQSVFCFIEQMDSIWRTHLQEF